MQFAIRIRSPQRALLSSFFAGVRTVVVAIAILLRWLLRVPFLSLGFVLRVVGGRVMAVWWSTALFLIAHGNAGVGHQIRYNSRPVDK